MGSVPGRDVASLVKIDDPNITMEEYIRLEEEKAHRRGKVYSWETATYGKIWDNEDVHDLGSVKTEFPAIVFNNINHRVRAEDALLLNHSSSLINSEIDCRISNDEFHRPTVSCFDDLDFFNDLENEFPAIVYNDAQTSKLDDLDYFKYFEKEFPAIVYNDAQTSKLDFSTEPVLNLNISMNLI
ncbi:hypothetical protein Tco_0485232 [Tanacetum coccineum]